MLIVRISVRSFIEPFCNFNIVPMLCKGLNPRKAYSKRIQLPSSHSVRHRAASATLEFSIRDSIRNSDVSFKFGGLGKSVDAMVDNVLKDGNASI